MANIGTSISPSPVITSLTKGRIAATGYTGNVTMALGENPSNAILSGTLTQPSVAGVATFNDLTLNRSGIGFTLRATGAAQGGVTPRAVTSRPFSIPTQLVFTTQPVGGVGPGEAMPTFVVTARDSAGNTDTSYTGDVTVSLYLGAGNAVLGGLFTTGAIAGVASFSGITVSNAGSYSLRAEGEEVVTAAKPSPKVSSTFSIGATLTAQLDPGVFVGFVSGVYGAITPTTMNGATIFALGVDLGTTFTGFSVTGNFPQSLFTSMTLNGNTYTSASAAYLYQPIPNVTSWSWAGAAITVGGSYPVGFT